MFCILCREHIMFCILCREHIMFCILCREHTNHIIISLYINSFNMLYTQYPVPINLNSIVEHRCVEAEWTGDFTLK
jgi:hypothetical protein